MLGLIMRTHSTLKSEVWLNFDRKVRLRGHYILRLIQGLHVAILVVIIIVMTRFNMIILDSVSVVII